MNTAGRQCERVTSATRRRFVLAAGALTVVPLTLRAQSNGKQVRMAILTATSQAKYQENEKLLIDAMRGLGWIEGRTIVYDRVYANDDESRLPALAGEIVGRGPSLIYTGQSHVIKFILARNRTIPIVCSSMLRPVEDGLVQSLAHPGGNITGITSLGWELGDKRLQLLKQTMPKLMRVGVLINPASVDSTSEFKLIEKAAIPLRASVIPATVTHASELEAALVSLAKERAEAVLTTHDPLFLFNRKQMLAAATKLRLPVAGHRGEIANSGALLSYSSILADQYWHAAQQVDKILKGAKPADIPVEQPTKFEFVINNKTAKALRIEVPKTVLVRADRVIE